VGIYFADRALKDSRIFDKDIYIIWWERIRAKWEQRTLLKKKLAKA
jgi:lipopolysaccharide export system permease protein